MELQLEFSTDKFRLTGALPDNINVGNKLYGEDLANWLCETLPQWRLNYLDEDWGWMVFSLKEYSPPNERNLICVYAYPEEDQGSSDSGNWMLSITTEYKTNWLWFLRIWTRGPYNSVLAHDVIAALGTLGVRDVTRTELS